MSPFWNISSNLPFCLFEWAFRGFVSQIVRICLENTSLNLFTLFAFQLLANWIMWRCIVPLTQKNPTSLIHFKLKEMASDFTVWKKHRWWHYGNMRTWKTHRSLLSLRVCEKDCVCFGSLFWFLALFRYG